MKICGHWTCLPVALTKGAEKAREKGILLTRTLNTRRKMEKGITRVLLNIKRLSVWKSKRQEFAQTRGSGNNRVNAREEEKKVM